MYIYNIDRNTQRSELRKQAKGETSDSYTAECFKSVALSCFKMIQ